MKLFEGLFRRLSKLSTFLYTLGIQRGTSAGATYLGCFLGGLRVCFKGRCLFGCLGIGLVFGAQGPKQTLAQQANIPFLTLLKGLSSRLYFFNPTKRLFFSFFWASGRQIPVTHLRSFSPSQLVGNSVGPRVVVDLSEGPANSRGVALWVVVVLFF